MPRRRPRVVSVELAAPGPPGPPGSPGSDEATVYTEPARDKRRRDRSPSPARDSTAMASYRASLWDGPLGKEYYRAVRGSAGEATRARVKRQTEDLVAAFALGERSRSASSLSPTSVAVIGLFVCACVLIFIFHANAWGIIMDIDIGGVKSMLSARLAGKESK